MKTGISIPDAIFEEAERLAKTRGWSRSELYSNAVSAYVNSERFLGVREKLDAVYAQNAGDSAVDSLSLRPKHAPAEREVVMRRGEIWWRLWESLKVPRRDFEGRY